MRNRFCGVAAGLALGWALCFALAAPVVFAQAVPRWHGARQEALQPEAEQLLALANETRAAHGAGPLRWDPALAEAARKHCLRMAAEGPISHQYGGEPDVSDRAGQAGAHFSLIEENVAIGPNPAAIHEEWMHSAGHKRNLLNPDIDRIGAAVVASRGELYAVADYARNVPLLTQVQVETAVAGLLRERGVVTIADRADARFYCERGHVSGGGLGSVEPRFRMLWQNPDLSDLPEALKDKLALREYRKAAVGSCPTQNLEGSFTAYRVAVLLY
jgi:uncharacterized protein YkwD